MGKSTGNLLTLPHICRQQVNHIGVCEMKIGPFRAFVSNKYYENRDEYVVHGQKQPYSFDEYWRKNLNLLKNLYRDKYRIVGDSND